jgi:hypothetical protein
MSGADIYMATDADTDVEMVTDVDTDVEMPVDDTDVNMAGVDATERVITFQVTITVTI